MTGVPLGHFSKIDEELTVGFVSKTSGWSCDHLVRVHPVLFVSAEEAGSMLPNIPRTLLSTPFRPPLKSGKLMRSESMV